jgi:hypothetical protein
MYTKSICPSRFAEAHTQDEEAANEAQCFGTALKNGHTIKEAEMCDDGDVGCPDCPWKTPESGGSVTITVPKVDVSLLRNQRDALLEITSSGLVKYKVDRLEGIISLLDEMLDIAEIGREQK